MVDYHRKCCAKDLCNFLSLRFQISLKERVTKILRYKSIHYYHSIIAKYCHTNSNHIESCLWIIKEILKKHSCTQSMRLHQCQNWQLENMDRMKEAHETIYEKCMSVFVYYVAVITTVPWSSMIYILWGNVMFLGSLKGGSRLDEVAILGWLLSMASCEEVSRALSNIPNLSNNNIYYSNARMKRYTIVDGICFRTWSHSTWTHLS